MESTSSVLTGEVDALGSVHALETYFMFGNWQALSERSAPGANKLPNDPAQSPCLIELANAMTSSMG